MPPKAVGFDVVSTLADVSASGQLLFNDSLLDLAAVLHDHGYKTAVMTSLGSQWRHVLTAEPRCGVFDRIIMAGDMKESKPNVSAFLKLAFRLGVEPGELIFIDDAPINTSYLDQFGVRYVRYTGLPALREQLQLAGLASDVLNSWHSGY